MTALEMINYRLGIAHKRLEAHRKVKIKGGLNHVDKHIQAHNDNVVEKDHAYLSFLYRQLELIPRADIDFGK